MNIPIPRRVRQDEPIKADWGNSVREAILKLAKSMPLLGPVSSALGGASYVPWDANMRQESGAYYVRFNLGTYNNVAASNWDAEHTLPDATTPRFVILEVTSADAQVTGLTISLSATPLTEDFVNKDTPPTTHKILLGVVSGSTKRMIVTTNLNAVAAEVFIESKIAPAVGAEPFSRWWRWNPSSV